MRFLATPLAKALVFLVICALGLWYATALGLRGLDVKSCRRQIVPRQVQRDFLLSDALFQRQVARAAGERPTANRERRRVAARWERDADRIAVPACGPGEIPYPFPF